MSPTGKHVDVQVIDIMKFDDAGRVHEHWGIADTLSMLQQLGSKSADLASQGYRPLLCLWRRSRRRRSGPGELETAAVRVQTANAWVLARASLEPIAESMTAVDR